MPPAQMQFTRILSFASSVAAERVRLMTAALAAEYAWSPNARGMAVSSPGSGAEIANWRVTFSRPGGLYS